MRSALGLCGLLMSSSVLLAQPYYVDTSNGSDANAGTEASPFQTIQKAADVMASGEVCIIRGGTYRETVTKNNLTFEAYPGETPIINGCDIVTGWSAHEGSIYKANVGTRVRAVFEDGEHMQLARYPNLKNGDRFNYDNWLSGQANGDASRNGVVMFDNESFPSGYWVGAHYTGLHGPNNYQATRGNVKSSNGNTLNLTEPNYFLASNLEKQTGEGIGYIINHLNALDANKEWYWGNNTLYFQSSNGADPSGKTIQAQTRLFGFDLSGTNGTTVKGIRFFATSLIADGSDDTTVDGCAFLYHSPWSNARESKKVGNGSTQTLYFDGARVDGSRGVFLGGSRNTVKSCYVAHAWGGGITTLDGSSTKVSNCYIEDFNWHANSNTVAIVTGGRDAVVERNTIRNTSAAGIVFVQTDELLVKRPKVMYNDFADHGKLLLDGGSTAIYINNQSAESDQRNLEGGRVAYNYIGRTFARLNKGKGFAIYLDDGTDGVTIDHNVVNAGDAINVPIFSNGAKHVVSDFYVYNNTMWNYPNVKGAFTSSINPTVDFSSREGVVMKNNLAQNKAYQATHKTDSKAKEVSNNLEYVQASALVNPGSANFQLAAGSPAIDAGAVVPGITDGFEGSAPDVGAYEFGTEPWTAGSTLTGDPTSGNSNPEPEPEPNPEPQGEGEVIVRARGLQGGEQIELLSDDTQVGQTITLTTEATDYTFEGVAAGSTLKVAFVNDEGVGHDVVVDYLSRDGTIYRADQQSVNTGKWGEAGGCGSGGSGKIMQCNGYIAFPDTNAARLTDSQRKAGATVPASDALMVYPNPSHDQVRIGLPSAMQQTARVEVVNLTGQVVQSVDTNKQKSISLSVAGLNPGAYLVKVSWGDQTATQRLLVE